MRQHGRRLKLPPMTHRGFPQRNAAPGLISLFPLSCFDDLSEFGVTLLSWKRQ